MKKIYISFILFTLIVGCQSSDTSVLEQDSMDIDVLSTGQFSFIDYMRSDELDSKIAYADSRFMILNYDVGHIDFSASTASIQMLQNGKQYRFEQLDTYDAEQKFQAYIDSFQLKTYSVREFMNSQTPSLSHDDSVALHLTPSGRSFDIGCTALKFGNTLFHANYSPKGVTEIQIVGPHGNFKKVLSSEPVPAPPRIGLRNVFGDTKKELFLAYPCDDYWDSRCFVLDIFDVGEFL